MNDLQMARTHDEHGFNLAIGEPKLLQDEIRNIGLISRISEDDFRYPASAGEEELLKVLRPMYPGRYVVVTNGAKQAISAALYALKVQGGKRVVHPSPHWPSYSTLAHHAGLEFSSFWTPDEMNERTTVKPVGDIWINTSPNNPDGDQHDYQCDIWDAAYACSLYNFNPALTPKHLIAVYSASKLYGLSGFRIGWLVTDDPRLAERAATYVETTTSGVSAFAQRYTALVIQWMSQPALCGGATTNGNRIYDHVRRLMNRNKKVFFEYLGSECQAYQNGGMFGWFRPKRQAAFATALKNAQVKLLTGSACGVSAADWYRINFGHTNEYTSRAIIGLKKALDEIV